MLVASSCLFLAALAASRTCHGADGEPPPPVSSVLRISAVGECPTPDAIAQTADSLIPRPPPDVSRRGGDVAVIDNGESYKVRLIAEGRPHVHIYRDAGRDCAQRARVVAVFIVLTLMPPELMVEPPAEPPPPPPPPVVVTPPPPAPPPPPWRFSLALAGVVDLAPAVLDAPSTVSAGGEIRGALAKRRLAVELGLGIQPSSDYTLAGLNVRQRRLPLDVSVALRQPVGPVRLGAAAGVATAIFDVEGQNAPIASGGTRLDVGGRAAVELRIESRSGRFAAFVGAHALCFPRRYELKSAPTGIVGHTPALWFGASLGAAAAF